MDNEPFVPVVVPPTYKSYIALLFIWLTPTGTQPSAYDLEVSRQRLAQIVDWRQACLDDIQLMRALMLLGDREELSPPPREWEFPRDEMRIPMGTISLSAPTDESERD